MGLTFTVYLRCVALAEESKEAKGIAISQGTAWSEELGRVFFNISSEPGGHFQVEKPKQEE